MAADAPDRRLDADEHVEVGRAQDRARSLGADVRRPEACGRPDPGTRASGEQGRPAVRSSGTLVAARVVRIHAEAEQGIVGSDTGRRRTGHPVGPFRHAGLGNDDRARVAKALHDRRFIRRYETLEGERAARGGHVDRLDVVLDRDRNAVQRPPVFAVRALAVERVGLLKRPRVDDHDCIELLVVGRDSRKVLQDELARCRGAARQGLLHSRDRGFHDAERLPRSLGARAQG